ncbi:reverse transcriptase [Ilyonectria robusta]
MLSPRVARQLFAATVAPAMDYASNVWTHARRAREAAWLNKAQLVGAQAITGAFRTVATAVAEAEASILTVEERHRQAATRFCINLRTLPKTHPLAALKNKASKRFISPMQKIVSAVERVHTERMEVIHEYALPPWTSRIPVVGENDLAKAAKAPNDIEGIIIATSSSKKGGIVGMGGVARNATRNNAGEVVTSYSVTLGPGDEQNPYTAELAAIAMALECTPPRLPFRDVTVMTSNHSAVEVIRRPRQQSGQCTIRQIYDRAKCLRKRGCSVRVMWVPAKVEGFALGPMAKAAAQRATKAECVDHDDDHPLDLTTDEDTLDSKNDDCSIGSHATTDARSDRSSTSEEHPPFSTDDEDLTSSHPNPGWHTGSPQPLGDDSSILTSDEFASTTVVILGREFLYCRNAERFVSWDPIDAHYHTCLQLNRKMVQLSTRSSAKILFHAPLDLATVELESEIQVLDVGAGDGSWARYGSEATLATILTRCRDFRNSNAIVYAVDLHGAFAIYRDEDPNYPEKPNCPENLNPEIDDLDREWTYQNEMFHFIRLGQGEMPGDELAMQLQPHRDQAMIATRHAIHTHRR